MLYRAVKTLVSGAKLWCKQEEQQTTTNNRDDASKTSFGGREGVVKTCEYRNVPRMMPTSRSVHNNSVTDQEHGVNEYW